MAFRVFIRGIAPRNRLRSCFNANKKADTTISVSGSFAVTGDRTKESCHAPPFPQLSRSSYIESAVVIDF